MLKLTKHLCNYQIDWKSKLDFFERLLIIFLGYSVSIDRFILQYIQKLI